MLLIKEYKNTPRIHFDPEQGKFEIVGKCYPENVRKFFDEVFSWVDDWNIEDSPEFYLEILYMSSASAIELVKLFKKIGNKPGGESVSIVWSYESDDDEAYKMGKTFSNLIDIPVSFKEIVE